MKNWICSLAVSAVSCTIVTAQDTTSTPPPPPPPQPAQQAVPPPPPPQSTANENAVPTASFGVTGGIGASIYSGTTADASGGMSWCAGLVWQYSGKSALALGFQPELLYVQEVITSESKLGNTAYTVESRFSHIRLPLMLKLALGAQNVLQPGVMAGMYGDYCVAGSTKVNNTVGDIANLQGFGYGAEFGVDVRFLKFISVDVKYYYALSNLIKDDTSNTRIHSLLASVAFLF